MVELHSTKDHALNSMKIMKDYFEEQHLCDVILIAGVDGKR